MSIPKPPRKRATAEEIAVRKIRVVQWLQSGMSYDEIAALEKITRKRVRETVAEAMKARDDDAPMDRRFINELMLAPALRLAAKAIVEGKLEGIDRLLEVVDRLEKPRPPAPPRLYDQNARERLLAKLHMNLDQIQARNARQAEQAPVTPANL